MRTRRILLNALSLTKGGGRSYVRNVLRELGRDSRGFEFTVVAATGQISRQEAGGLDLVELSFGTSASSLSVLRRVLYEQAGLPLRARNYDLLYCLGDLSPIVGWTPTVVALRNPNIYDHRFYDNIRLRLMNALVRISVRRARRVVFPSRAAADLIAERVSIPDDRIRVVPHGISTEAFGGYAGDRNRGGEYPRYVFLPAALERHKNMEVLIRSLAHVADPELQVWIAGGDETDPRYGAELKTLARRTGVEDRVRFLGPVPYERILCLFRESVALVFPSWLETFGHPLLEAMVAETPIIASDIPPFREISGDAALYFPPDDPVHLARAIDRVLMQHDDTKTRIVRGRDRAEDLSWRHSVDRLCEVFEDALTGG